MCTFVRVRVWRMPKAYMCVMHAMDGCVCMHQMDVYACMQWMWMHARNACKEYAMRVKEKAVSCEQIGYKYFKRDKKRRSGDF